MPFTAQELSNIGNAALDYHIREGVHDNAIQVKPLMRIMKQRQKTFPGGKELITKRVKGVHTSRPMGFSHDQIVTYGNPANIKKASTSWYEMHEGIEVTLTELKHDGISVVDSARSENTSMHSDREMTALADLLEDKLQDMSEGWAEGFQTMLWDDGTADPTLTPGIRSFILDDPTAAGQTFGIDRTLNTWWRNRASLLIDTSTPANQVLVNTLQSEWRQLIRYAGGKPTHALCGSTFLNELEGELRAKGNYTDQGWSAKDGGKNMIDVSIADVGFKGMMFEYDPWLDEAGLDNYLYWLDLKNISMYVMDGEDEKKHNPSRPHDRYVLYKAMTWTGGLLARMLRSSGVYSVNA